MITDAEKAIIRELVDAIVNHRVVWANEGKVPGWCDRVDAAKRRVNAGVDAVNRLLQGGAP